MGSALPKGPNHDGRAAINDAEVSFMPRMSQPKSSPPEDLGNREKVMAFFFLTAIVLMLIAKFVFGY